MRKLSLLLTLALLTVACAKQGYPTGGPKDVEPPKVVEASPANETRQFTARQFFIEFDEYVVLKNADNNVLVSPPLGEKPEYTTKGHGVLVKLNDTLRANTTYLFQFKEAIADFNEGNVLSSYEYVFSTGDQMDTLMMAGRVTAARNGKPWEETLTVLAYRPDDTLPALVTRTDKSGHYAFHYIPEGRYRIVALEDKNKNLTVDSSEAVAWDTTYHVAVDSIDSNRMATLYISAPDRRVQRVLKAEFTERGHITISTLLPMQHPTVTGEKLLWRLNGKRDTLNLWCLNEQCDSTVLILTDEGLHDTLKLRYRSSAPSGRRSNSQQLAKTPLMKTLCDGSKAFYDSLMIAFTAPVTPIGDTLQAEITRLKDSSTSLYPIVLDSSGLKARLDAVLQSGEEYRIRIAEGLFADPYGRTSDSLNFKLTPKDYGTLTLHVNNHSGSALVIEVLDKHDTIVQHKCLAGSGDVRFTHLPAGEYRLRAVIDRNGDGQWTTGDYHQGRQPEEHRLFEKTLQLREKWEMEEQWRIGNSRHQPVKEIIRPTTGGVPAHDITPIAPLKRQ